MSHFLSPFDLGFYVRNALASTENDADTNRIESTTPEQSREQMIADYSRIYRNDSTVR